MIGRASSCAAVMAPWLAAAAMPTRFSAGFSTSATLRNVLVPVTTTSAVNDSARVTSAVSGCAAGDGHGAPQHAEIEQAKRQLRRAWRDGVEAIVTGGIRRGTCLARADEKIDSDAWKRRARLIEDATADHPHRLRRCGTR